MTDTLEQLRRQFATPCPTLTVVREQYFAHMASNRYLLRKISEGRIKLKVTRLGGSAKGTAVVYLQDLADYLDAHAPEQAA